MSLFFLTTEEKTANKVKQEYVDLFEGDTKIINHWGTYLVVTSAYKKKILMDKNKHRQIYCFGTIFNEEGFNETALKSITDYGSFINNGHNKLFGHYILIFLEGNSIYLVSDKVGLINIYLNENEENFYVSNDLFAIGKNSSNGKLNKQGIYQFILKESNIGTQTIFDDVRRLNIGRTICINQKKIEVSESYSYSTDNLSAEDYILRVEKYFRLLNNYDGKITTDISGGFDTRLVASIATYYIDDIEGNTNPNKFDGGIDTELSPIVAKKLGIPLVIIENPENATILKTIMFRGFSLGRDIYRSKIWPHRLEKKYSKFNLVLGGYGGESIRAKYNKKEKIGEIALDYYMGLEAERILGFNDYLTSTIEELQEYPIPDNYNKEQLGNWLYTIDRMRIWGGSQVLMSSLHGDILHPFMDWYLINPIFRMSLDELKEGAFQKLLINKHAPQLINLPINQHINKRNGNYLSKFTKNIKKIIKKNSLLKSKAIKTLNVINRNKNIKKMNHYFEQYPKSNFCYDFLRDVEVDLMEIINCGDVDIISRLATVNEIYKYIKNNE